MGFLKMLEKKNVPDELPALVTDEIKKKLEESKAKDMKEEIKQEIQVAKTEPEKIQANDASQTSPNQMQENQIQNNIAEKQDQQENKVIEEEKPEIKNNIPAEAHIKNVPEESPDEEKNYSKLFKDSFFIKLQENLSKEMNSLDKLEEWYNNKLLPKDTLSEMKTYWEKQNSNSVIQALGKDFQDKITGKISTLQNLEKKWQDTYFDLMEKEEKIKEEEKELKKMLSEFIQFCKKRIKDGKADETKPIEAQKQRKNKKSIRNKRKRN